MLSSMMGVRRERNGSVRFSSNARSWATTQSSSNGRGSTRSWSFREGHMDAIGVRSRHDRGWFNAWSRPRSFLIDGPRSSCDRGHQFHRSTGSNGRDFREKIPFKNRCIPLFFLTLDWFVKQFSEFGAKSWVLHDPPAFRLDCKAIRAGLITNHHRISLNFPLEFRTSARKKSSKIRFNPHELKPHSCKNQVSSEIRSIIRW